MRAQLADLYRNFAVGRLAGERQSPMTPSNEQQRRVMDSSNHLMQHIDEVPVLVVPCIEDTGGAAGWAPSIYPAVWSFMLALRSRGLGSVITTVHLYRREDAARLLGVPEGFVQS